MHPFIENFIAKLVKNHITDIRAESYATGVRDGKLQMHPDLAKLQSELVEAKLKPASWEIRDDRSPVTVASDASLYGPDRFNVRQENIARMHAEVAWAVSEKLISPPTQDQWQMILSDHPATCVVAGAGSGKSTTLVLRVVFMLCHLGIRPQDMTVVSFTRESCKELRGKLVKVLSIDQWKTQLSQPDASNLNSICENLVSTFHAALSRLSKKYFPGTIWFDVLKKNETGEVLNQNDESEIENIFNTGTRLSDAQLEMLQETYRECFTHNNKFKTHIIEILKFLSKKIALGNDTETPAYTAIANGSSRDLEIVQRINQNWDKKGWVMPGIDATPFKAFNVNGFPFYANGKIEATGMPIFLSLNGYIDNIKIFDDSEEINGFKIFNAVKVRAKVIKRFNNGNSLEIKTTKDLELLRYRLDYLDTDILEHKVAPRINISLDGGVNTSDIVEAFYSQASFIENLGMEVPKALAQMPLFKEHKLEHHFAAALAHFWPAFEQHLNRQPKRMMTFNRAFLLLGENYEQSSLPYQATLSDLSNFSHLLIDEFQDISPQIVSWLRATQRKISTFDRNPSIMAIGDDWQSIYGWRGSAPEFFIKFDDHFPVHPDLGVAKICRMMENYRSVEPVIADAEKLLTAVNIKINKKAIAKRETEYLDHGVKMISDIDPSSNTDIVIATIEEQLALVRTLPKSDKNKIIVLSRSAKLRDKLKKEYGTSQDVAFYTFHGSKGLQGEVAILCETSDYNQEHALRNAIYRASGLFSQTYDQAAKDESLRLAYVAVTRGIRRVFWFVSKPQGATELFN